MSDASDRRRRWRVRWAVALLLFGLLGAVVPALAAGSRFLPNTRHTRRRKKPIRFAIG